MVKKMISLTVFAALFIGAFVYFQFEKSSAGVVKAAEQPAFDYDKWVEQQSEELAARLPFPKPIGFVYVTEMSERTLAYVPTEELAKLKLSYNEDTKSIYFYDSSDLPDRDDNLLVVKDSNVFDILLDQTVTPAADLASVRFDPIRYPEYPDERQPVVNEARPFLNEQMEIRLLDGQGAIEVTFDNRTVKLAVGESHEFTRAHPEITGAESQVFVKNFGMWNSQDMTYTVRPENQ